MKCYAVVVLAVLVVVFGCSSPGPTPDDQHRPAAIPLSSGIWHVERGEPLGVDRLAGELEEARFVAVGESHGRAWDHTVQHSIVEELVARTSADVAVGMEMIERRFQEHVDAYLAGEIDEAEMLRRVEFEERWGIDEMFYAPHWRLAKDRGFPLVALNARRELVSRVGDVGLEGLDDDERAELPEIEGDDDYRSYLRHIFAAHQMDDEDEFQHFFEAQLVWDETMAETAWRFMEDRDVGTMVLLAGRGHLERGFGIPPRLVRRGAEPQQVVTVVPVSAQTPRDEYTDLEYLRDHEVADYVWIEP